MPLRLQRLLPFPCAQPGQLEPQSSELEENSLYREADPFSETKQITKVSQPRWEPGRLPTQGILHTLLSTLKVFPAFPATPKAPPQ